MPSPTEITVSQLTRLIGTATAPVVIDVRLDEDFDTDPVMIPTARRCAHGDIVQRVSSLNGHSVVVVCHGGLKLSQGAAALLRSHGLHAETLAGGQLAWREANAPVFDPRHRPVDPHQSGSLWVTRQRPKIDRLACPWLIRRFIDPAARFLFVAPDQVLAVAERFGAEPFDVDGATWQHDDERCTFDILLDAFGLQSDALRRMARIVRGADLGRHELAPECAGLLAVSLGLSRMFRDDLAQLEAGLTVYDALYRWARDAVQETHAWPDGHRLSGRAADEDVRS